MSTEELEKSVRDIIAQSGATGPGDFGKVMPQVMKQLKGKADGRLIQETVKKLLGAS
jgi:uncharacterized protein YqeY